MTNSNTLPLEKIEGYIWIDGKLEKWSEVRIHVLTHSLHYSGGIFEGIKAIEGKIFKEDQHTKRFFKSAELMGLKIDLSEIDFINAMYKTLESNNLKNAYIRPFAWRSTDIITVRPQNPKTHIMIAAWEPRAPVKKNPLKLKIGKWKKPNNDMYPVQCKSSAQYAILTLSIMDAIENGFDDALILDLNNKIAECTTSNIFFIKDDKLFTPTTNYCLNGITRQTVIEIANKNNIQVIEKDISLDELINFESSFITGTASGLKLISSIDLDNNKVEFKDSNLFATLKAEYEKLLLRR